MKVKKAGRRVLALALALAMLLSACQVVFALDPPEEQPTVKYVSFGDSMSNGFGLDGYSNNGWGSYGDVSYPELFAEWLESLGYGVEHSEVGESCTRIEDANFLLRFPLDAEGEEEEIINSILSTNISTSTMKSIWDECKTEWRSVFGSAGDAFTWNEFIDGRWVTHCGNVRQAAAEAQYAVANADIISTGLGDSNFGVFLMGRLMSMVGFGSGYYDNGFAYDWADLESALYDLPDAVRAYILEKEADLREALLAEYGDFFYGFFGSKTDDLIDVLEYTIVSFMYNYYEFIDRCVELNPDVTIISVGLMNTMTGLEIEVAEGVSFDMGDILGAVYDVLNPYMYFVTSALQLGGKYENATFYFVECPDDVDTIYETYAQLYDWDWTNKEFNVEGSQYEGLDALMIRYGYGHGYDGQEGAVVDDVSGLVGYFNDYFGSAVYQMLEIDKHSDEELVYLIQAYEAFMDRLNEYCTTDVEKATELALVSQNQSSNDYGITAEDEEFKNLKAALVAAYGAEFSSVEKIDLSLSQDAMTLVQIYLGFEEAVVNASKTTKLGYQTLGSFSDLDSVVAGVAGKLSTLTTTTQEETLAAYTAATAALYDEEGQPTLAAYKTAYAYFKALFGLDDTTTYALLKVGYEKKDNDQNIVLKINSSETNEELIANVVDAYRTYFLTPAIAGCTKLSGVNTAVAEALGEEPMNSLLHMLGRLVIANGVGAHPTANVHREIAERMEAIFSAGITANDIAADHVMALLEELAAYLTDEDGFKADALAYAIENGYVEKAQTALEELKAELLERKASLETNTAAQVAELVSILQAQLDQLDNNVIELQNIVVELGTTYEVLGKEFVLETEAQVEEAIEYVKAQIAAIDEQIAQINRELLECEDELQTAIADVEGLIEAFKNTDLEALKAAALDLDIDSIRAQFNLSVDAVLATVQDIMALYAAVEEVVNGIPEKAVAIYNIILDTHDGLVERVDAFEENVLETLDAYRDATLAAMDAAYEKVSADYAAAMAELQAAHDAMVDDIYAQEAAFQAKKAELEAEFAAKTAEYQAKRDAFLEEHEEVRFVCRAVLAGAYYLGTEAKEAIEEQVNTAVAAVKAAIADAEAQLTAALNQAEEDKDAAVAEARQKLQEALEKIDAEAAAKMAELNAKYDEAESEALAALNEVYAAYLEAKEAYGPLVEANLEATAEALQEKYDEYAPVVFATIEEANAALKDIHDEQVEKALATLNAVHEEAKAQLAAAEAELKKQQALLVEAFNEAVEEAKAELANQVAIANALVEAEIAHAQETLEAQSAVVDAALEAQLIELNAQIYAFVLDVNGRIEALIELLHAMYLSATTGVIYKTSDALYVALGDASAVDTYVELVADELGLNAVNLAYAGNTLQNIEYDIISNYAYIANADFITLGYSNVQYLRDALQVAILDGEEPDWAAVVDEDNMKYVEFALEELKAQIAAQLEGTAGEDYAEEVYLAIEVVAYEALYYAVAMPQVASIINQINPTALVAVISQYNPLKNATIVVDDNEIEVGSYVDYFVTAMEHYGVISAFLNGTYIEIAAPDVEMEDAQEEYTIKSLVRLAYTDLAGLNPSEAGAEYIKEQIVNAVVVVDAGLLGDVNLDGVVNSRDATMILQYEVGLITEDDLCLAVADVNGDGYITSRDATNILQLEVGLIESFEEVQ